MFVFEFVVCISFLYMHTVLKNGFLGFSCVCLGVDLGLPSLGCSGVCLRFCWVFWVTIFWFCLLPGAFSS